MNETEHVSGKEKYSTFFIAFKWILGIIEYGGGAYILYDYHLFAAIIYLAYVAVSGGVILPLASCVNCYYFGSKCHNAWGKVVSRIHSRGNTGNFAKTFPWRILLYPVWALPLAGAAITLARVRNQETAIIVGIYIVILYVNHRLLMRYPACRTCRQRFNCPGCQYKDYAVS
ncbi:MAG: hypothetical protein GF307_11795 [candidate division Zixibacteria bacterium]|nr:hypothetical protein [candidate division Zixibacteria bacterium]